MDLNRFNLSLRHWDRWTIGRIWRGIRQFLLLRNVHIRSLKPSLLGQITLVAHLRGSSQLYNSIAALLSLPRVGFRRMLHKIYLKTRVCRGITLRNEWNSKGLSWGLLELFLFFFQYFCRFALGLKHTQSVWWILLRSSNDSKKRFICTFIAIIELW